MTEIKNNLPTKTYQQEKPLRPGPTNAQANTISGLASGLDTKQIMDTIIQVEQRRLSPIKARKASAQVELDSYTLVKTSLETLQKSVNSLADQSIWEGKLVESSNEAAVVAIGTTGAKPGKHTLVVDKLALNHQISSQGFKDQDQNVGTGSVKISVGKDSTFTVVLDESNNTLTGLKDSINRASSDVSATIIKTGAKELSSQLVLTSQKTGSEGRINLEIELQGGEAPSFKNSVETPSNWKGVAPSTGAPTRERGEAITGVGASTAIVRVVGEYNGEENKEFKFTAVQTGVVGGENSLQIRWEDDSGRNGLIDLDSFNYAPGEPLAFVDGLSLVIGQGEIIVGDQFSFLSRAERSLGSWWVSEQDRTSGYTQPTPWSRQATLGAPLVSGALQAEDEINYKLTVLGEGQIGGARDLAIRWENEKGETGVVRTGQGYIPGSPLALNRGLTLTLKPGVLSNGSVSTFTAVPAQSSRKWWLPEEEQLVPASIQNVTNFVSTEVVQEDDEPKFTSSYELQDEDIGPKVSSSLPLVSGDYTGDDSRVYTFTPNRDGSVGITKGLTLDWKDDKGNSGTLEVGDGYAIDGAQEFNSGLSIAFGGGKVFKGDSFTLRTHTATIQPAQDALIRFGATELGGGLPITSSTNEFENVIEGVKLTLAAVNEKPVTITIKGDTKKAGGEIRKFSDEFSQLILLINELTKFDPDNNQVGPLLGDRDVGQIRNDLSKLVIDPVAGLPKSLNMLVSLGMKVGERGDLVVDEATLDSKIGEDFAAVANMFRNRGESDNSGITFIRMSDDTKVNPQGYEIDISQLASRGYYLSPEFQGPIEIGENNKSFFITVNGVQSQAINLNPGLVTPTEYVGLLQNAITNDENIGKSRVTVALEGGKIKVTSGRFGARSTIAFSATSMEGETAPGLTGGESVEGSDVAGTIDGEPAEGVGQLMRGADTSDRVKGLRLLVTLSETQLNEGPEAHLKVTKGVASKLALHLAGLLDPRLGNMQRITSSLRTQLKDLETQLQKMDERIESKREQLQVKFAKLEGQMSKLKSQQNFMNGQIANLPKSGDGK